MARNLTWSDTANATERTASRSSGGAEGGAGRPRPPARIRGGRPSRIHRRTGVAGGRTENPADDAVPLGAAYAANGLAGLARKGREDAGKSRSACLLARDYLEFLYCDQNKLTQNLRAGETAGIGRPAGAGRLRAVPLPARVRRAKRGNCRRAPAATVPGSRERTGCP